MADIRLMPVAGINLVAEDEALFSQGDSQRLYVRDAVNIDLTPAGKASLRQQMDQVTANRYQCLWQSPLHKDVFAVFAGDWVKVDPIDWTSESLAYIGDGDVSHEVLNNLVCVAGQEGIFTFNGSEVQRLGIQTPAKPMVSVGVGSLTAGTYGIAIAWLRGSLESATSLIESVGVPHNGSLEITFPLCLDSSVDGVRLYITKPNGGELGRCEDYPISTASLSVSLLPSLGMPPMFRHMSPMPTGKFLKYWRGRLLTAKANVLRFSEALAYHLHDERHGFVQMPQRITFVQPVDGGIWVGQVDHVAFLSGDSPANMTMNRKSSRAPIPNSAISIDADSIGADMSGGGSATVIWLAENGYVAGSSSGQVVELHAGVMKGIAANSGTSVVLGRRVMTAVI